MSDRPEDVDAAFAAIVADLEREGLGADVDTEPTEELAHPPQPGQTGQTGKPTKPGKADEPEATPAAEPPASPAPAWRGHDTDWDWSWSTDDEHYVPPEPPPLPRLRLRPLTILALVMVVAGVLLLIAPSLVGLRAEIGTPISLLALTCGFGLLFLRVRRTPPDPDDNGAQV